mgnify:CR=1 FL=1
MKSPLLCRMGLHKLDKYTYVQVTRRRSNRHGGRGSAQGKTKANHPPAAELAVCGGRDMERLTKWNESSYKHAYYPRCFKEPCYGSGCKIKDCPFEIAVCERLAAYEDTGLTPKEVTALGELFDYALKESKTLTEQLTLLKHIRKLAEADKDGRVIVLPAKKGDTLYAVTRFGVEKRVVKEIAAPFFYNTYESSDRAALSTDIRNFGKTVFLTHEEAEKALQEMEGKKDG